MKSALRSRGIWRRQLTEAAVAHEATSNGECCCASKVYLCVTRQTTDRTSNKGVASTIDQIESLS
jgi:hypothetical protein